MRTINEAVAWAKAHDGKPGPGGPGHCLEAVRTAYGTGPWATSAKLAYERTPHDQLHTGHDWHAIPAGAICYYAMSDYGHVTISIGGAKCLSTDYKTRGLMSISPIDLPAWHGDSKFLAWTFWTPDGIAHN